MPFCTNCGTLLQPDSKFCVKCGTPVQTEPEKTENENSTQTAENEAVTADAEVNVPEQETAAAAQEQPETAAEEAAATEEAAVAEEPAPAAAEEQPVQHQPAPEQPVQQQPVPPRQPYYAAPAPQPAPQVPAEEKNFLPLAITGIVFSVVISLVGLIICSLALLRLNGIQGQLTGKNRTAKTIAFIGVFVAVVTTVAIAVFFLANFGAVMSYFKSMFTTASVVVN